MEWYLWVSLSGISSVVAVKADPEDEAASVKDKIFMAFQLLRNIILHF